MTEIKPL